MRVASQIPTRHPCADATTASLVQIAMDTIMVHMRNRGCFVVWCVRWYIISVSDRNLQLELIN